jgi:hypothetical protein
MPNHYIDAVDSSLACASAPVDADATTVAADPDSRRPVSRCAESGSPQQSQQQLRVLPIRFLLAHSPGLNFGQISDPQLQPKLVQQTLEPARVSAGLHAHPCGSISLV